MATVPSSAGGGGQSATAYGQQTNYSVSGSRPVGMAYMLDNTDIRNALDHGAGVSVMGTSLGMEAIQEFTILTNTYSAEFGGTGAAVNAVTKSGTNDLHGSAYEYIRNSALDAMNYFDVPGQKPPFKRNQFGGSLGGPIKKDKAFFFVNYEGLRAGTGPTVARRGADLVARPVRGRRHDARRQRPVGQALRADKSGVAKHILPVSACPEPVPMPQCKRYQPFCTGTGLFCSHGTQIGNEDYVLGRVDYTLGPKDSLFGRYARESAYQLLPYAYTQVPGYPEIDHERNQYLTIEERHMFSPKILNEVRFGFVRLFTETANGGVNANSGPRSRSPAGRLWTLLPAEGLTRLGPSPSSPSRPVTNRFSVGDDVIMSLGAHSLRFGATVTRAQLNHAAGTNIPAAPGSSRTWVGADRTVGRLVVRHPIAGCVRGRPQLQLYHPGRDRLIPSTRQRYWRQTWLDPYIQDDWKITKRLTLNIGLRYEWASNPTTVGEPIFVINNLTSPTTTEGNFVAAKHPFTSNPNVKNFDPRIGLAWDPFGDHKTSVRAGFGIFHEPVTARTYALDNTSMRPNEPLFFLFFSTGLSPICLTVPTRS